MFSFHKPKVYRSTQGCCICKAKSSSSRFTDSAKYENDFIECFQLSTPRRGEICNACVLLVKRYKRLPPGSNRHWGHVVDARVGPGLKSMTKFKKRKEEQLLQQQNGGSKIPNQNVSQSAKTMSLVSERFGKIFKKNKKKSLITAKRNGSPAGSSDENSSPASPISANSDTDEIKLNHDNRLPIYEKADYEKYGKTKILKRNQRKSYHPLKNRSLIQASLIDQEFWHEIKTCCGIIYENKLIDAILIAESSKNLNECKYHQCKPVSVPVPISSTNILKSGGYLKALTCAPIDFSKSEELLRSDITSKSKIFTKNNAIGLTTSNVVTVDGTTTLVTPTISAIGGQTITAATIGNGAMKKIIFSKMQQDDIQLINNRQQRIDEHSTNTADVGSSSSSSKLDELMVEPNSKENCTKDQLILQQQQQQRPDDIPIHLQSIKNNYKLSKLISSSSSSSSSSGGAGNAGTSNSDSRAYNYLHKIKSDSSKVVKSSLNKITPSKLKNGDIVRNLVKLCTEKSSMAKVTPITIGNDKLIEALGSKFNENSSDSGYEEILQESNQKGRISSIRPVILANGIKLHVQPQNLVLAANLAGVSQIQQKQVAIKHSQLQNAKITQRDAIQNGVISSTTNNCLDAISIVSQQNTVNKQITNVNHQSSTGNSNLNQNLITLNATYFQQATN